MAKNDDSPTEQPFDMTYYDRPYRCLPRAGYDELARKAAAWDALTRHVAAWREHRFFPVYPHTLARLLAEGEEGTRHAD